MKNLQEMSLGEMRKVQGGGGSKGIWFWLAEQVIDHWGDIREGWEDGGKGKPRY